jgi:hypothetical protein
LEAGVATLTVTKTEDYGDGTPVVPANTTDIVFDGPAASVATFKSHQFGGSPISDIVAITGNSLDNIIRVNMTEASSFSAAGWSFSNWHTSPEINGSSGADTITGSALADVINGGGGDDHFRWSPGGGADTYDGGAGVDTLDYVSQSGFDQIWLIPWTNHGVLLNSSTNLELHNIENVDIQGGGGNDRLTVADLSQTDFTGLITYTGGDGDHTIDGARATNAFRVTLGAGTDNVMTGSADDLINGGPGDDVINGGAGTDGAVFSGNLSSYTLTHLSGGTIRVSGPDGIDTLSNIEQLVFSDRTLSDVTHVFGNPSFAFVGFSPSAGGWTSQDQYPRTAADVNGDGRADLVGFGSAGVYVSLSNGDGTFANTITASGSFGASGAAGGWASDDHYPRVLGDVNGDSHADIVGFGNAGTYVALANADGTFGTAALAVNSFGSSAAAGGWSSNDQYPRQIADVNGDGRADIVGFGSAGVYVSLANTHGTFDAAALGTASFGSSTAAGDWKSETSYPRVLGDVNGDGRADIVGFGSAGVYVALANADGTFQSASLALHSFGASSASGGWTSNDLYPRQVADVNADGMGDVVGFGSNGAYVAFATGNGNFASGELDLNAFGRLAGGWATQDQYPRVLADINADGASDIIGFAHDGVHTASGNFFF